MGKVLPKDIQAQIDEAKRIEQEIAKAANQESQEGEPEAAGQDVSFDAEQNTVEEVAQDDGAEEAKVEGEYAKAEKSDAKPTEDENSETYAQRFKSTLGRYQAEQRKNNQLVRQNEELLERLQAMEDKLNRWPGPDAPKQPAATEDLTPEEIDDYGADLIEVMKKTARATIKGELDALRRENEELKKAVSGVGQRQVVNERDKFYTQLGNEVSNWQVINTDPAFLAWLDEPDVFAGRARMDLLQEAFSALDVNRVKQFFKAFDTERAAVSQPPSESAPQPSRRGNGKVSLEQLAAPGTGSSGTADAPSGNNQTVWKESEIQAFYEDVRKGKFRGRKDQRAAFEASIQQAMNKGQILVGQ